METAAGRPDITNDPALAAAIRGDEEAFASLTRRYRRELHVHCYRMLASFHDAEDLVQETFLRAWQKRDTFQGRAPFRAWLYRIATNACLDFLARHERRVMDVAPRGASGDATVPHVEWLQPFPDRIAEGAAADAAVLRRETIELAFIVAMQYLPPKQRAVLILRDVLDWSAAETAALLEMSVPAVNGALQRARATLERHRPTRDAAPGAHALEEDERRLVRAYADATERCDIPAVTQMLSEDVRFSMPPAPAVFAGRDDVVRSWVEGGFGAPPYDDFKCIITRANGMPAVANYMRRPGREEYEAFTMDVLHVAGGRIVEITAFDIADLFGAFGLPMSVA